MWEPLNAVIIVLTVAASEIFNSTYRKRIAQGSIAAVSILLHLIVRPYADEAGNFVVCKGDCQPGNYIVQDQSACTTCPDGEYNLLLNQSECLRCVDITTLDENNKNITKSYYKLFPLNTTSSKCGLCSEYAHCNNGVCETGFDYKRECTACIPGEYHGSKCSKCPEAWVSLLQDGIICFMGLYAMKLFVQQTIQVNATIVGYVFVSTALLMRRVMGQYITHMETLVPGTNGNVVEPIYVRS